MTKWIIRLVLLAAIVGGVVALRATVFAPEPLVVTVVAVERGRVEATLTNSKAGTVKARRRAKLSPGTSGIVIELPVQRGQHVKAGDLLLRLDDEAERAQVALAERAVEVAEANNRKACVRADRALRELERNQALVEKGIVSPDTIEAYENAHDLAIADCVVAEAEIARTRAALDVAQVALSKTELRAPFDAILGEVSVELGEWVTPSVPLVAAPDLIDAIDPSSLYLSAPMDEVDTAKLQAGMSARALLDPYPDQSFPARLVRVAPYVLDLEQQNRTVEIEVEIEDTELSRTLLPGTSADVEVLLEVKEDTLRVPTHTLLEGDRVLVIEDGVLVRRQLEIGLRNWDYAEVLNGLEEGDEIVASLDRAGIEPGASVVIEGRESN